MRRLLLGGLIAATLAACGGTAATTAPRTSTAPGQATAAGAATSAPGPAGTTAPAPAGNVENVVRSLIPTGALELSHAQVGGQYSVQLSSQSPLADLQSFWDQKIPSLGLNQTGKIGVADSVTYAFTNPDGGIVVASDGSGGWLITISAGTSS